jgi:hypothetical protein
LDNTIFVLCALICVNAQYIPIGVGKKQPTCKYEFTVPDTKGACSTTSAALDKKIDDIKQEIRAQRTTTFTDCSIFSFHVFHSR